MLTLFLIGTFWFWVLLALEFILLLIFVEYEKPGLATISLIATLSLLAFLGDFNILWAAKDHPLQSAIAVAAYFVIGTLWSFGKWWFFVRAAREKYDAFMKSFKKNLEDFHEKDTKPFIPVEARKPTASANKGRIMIWMTYWPTSMLWTIVNDPVKRIFKEIFRRVRAVYDAISDHMYKGTNE